VKKKNKVSAVSNKEKIKRRHPYQDKKNHKVSISGQKKPIRYLHLKKNLELIMSGGKNKTSYHHICGKKKTYQVSSLLLLIFFEQTIFV
jgi:hypothetical protein